METPGIIILGIVLIAFIAGGLVWAFIADRRRNQEVAHDPERAEPDPTTAPGRQPGHHPGADPRADRP